MTGSREDYLKAIYSLGGDVNFVSNKDLASKLEIAAASVSEMMLCLQKEGLVEYRPYHGTKLTDEGLKICNVVVKNHRLWEVFLMRHLGYSWAEAHEEAELLEHATTLRLVERLDKFLNYPTYCPHGSLIPREGENIDALSILLSDLEVDEEAIVEHLIEEKELLDYLENLGLLIGEKIKIINKEPYEGSISFKQGKKKLTLSYKAASQVYVRIIDA